MYDLSSAMYGLSSVKYGLSSAMYEKMSAKYEKAVFPTKSILRKTQGSAPFFVVGHVRMGATKICRRRKTSGPTKSGVGE
jgi:hypothetical protein